MTTTTYTADHKGTTYTRNTKSFSFAYFVVPDAETGKATDQPVNACGDIAKAQKALASLPKWNSYAIVPCTVAR
jgi:hypothetical protein